MEYYSSQISQLVEQLASLPGIGAKTAQRLAFYLLSLPAEEAQEFADAIVEAVGKVGYGIGYTPALAAAQDSILFAMNPKPLTLAVNLGGEGDEAQTLAVEVQVEAPQTGGYSVEDGNMKFHFVVSEVFLGEGDNRVALPGFAPITFDMDLNQARPAQHF